ncbi:zona pellucida sperm-binding protein 4-like [Amia ocellicauda]|uniref:zona pellucida sperm-binding protein 4-like n=1 Tax=Amia ocellicauda TaxID=2972642 RepID=UPI003463F562
MERSGMSVRVWSLVCLLMAAAVDVSIAQGQNCSVSDNEKMVCGAPAISRADCEASNCCFDQRGRQPCYYSNEGEWYGQNLVQTAPERIALLIFSPLPPVTVQCTTDGQFVVVVPRNVTRPPLSLDTVSLLGGQGAPCSPVGTTAGFALFQFPVSACGSTLKVRKRFPALGGDVVYENTMSSKRDVQEGPDGSITRDSYYELTFLCKYSGTLVHGHAMYWFPMHAGFLKLSVVPPVEAVYDAYYGDGDYPVTKVLRDPVYVEVRILNRTDPNIVLTLEDCWATSTPSPLGQPQWSLLVAGCPYRDDQYQTTLVPVAGSSGLPYPTHYKRFIVQMFTFVDAGSQLPLKAKVRVYWPRNATFPMAALYCTASRAPPGVHPL